MQQLPWPTDDRHIPVYQLNCVRGEHIPLFCCCDLDINPMTLKLDILKMYFHAKKNCQVEAFKTDNSR